MKNEQKYKPLTIQDEGSIQSGDECRFKNNGTWTPVVCSIGKDIKTAILYHVDLEFRRPITQEPLKLEVGKSYRTRDGRKATALSDKCRFETEPNGFVCLVHGEEFDSPMIYFPDGRYWPTVKDGRDIVEAWLDKPIVNWADMPRWAKFVAMDADKKWFLFTNKPIIGGDGLWVTSRVSQCYRVPEDYAPQFTGDWKDSLVGRPNDNHKDGE